LSLCFGEGEMNFSSQSRPFVLANLAECSLEAGRGLLTALYLDPTSAQPRHGTDPRRREGACDRLQSRCRGIRGVDAFSSAYHARAGALAAAFHIHQASQQGGGSDDIG
jgi:hypothetical protein